MGVVAVVMVVAAVALVAAACVHVDNRDAGPPPGATAVLSPEAVDAAVAPAVDAVGQMVDATIDVGGRTRSYHLYVPSTLVPGTAVPLLVALHGGIGWGTQFEANSGFDRLAESNRFLVVYPNGVGVGRTGDRLRTWNAGMCCGPAMKNQVDDVAFVSALIDRISADHDVDASRVFVTGHSNGAMLGYRLACELSDKVAAAAVVAGTLAVSPCEPAHPVSFMEIHGTADRNVPIDGGRGDRSLASVEFPSPRSSIATMAQLMGCTSEPTTRADGDLTTTDWTSPTGSTEVRFVAITGASHAWPGSAPGRLNVAGTPYAGYDASREIWAFLSTHPRVG